MWLINGPFDCTVLGDEETLKTKLLKTNRAYGVGRHQDSPLCINSKKISRQHGQFIVGEHSEDDVSNGALVPTLSLRNNKTTAIKFARGENMLLVNPDSTHELESGDVVYLTGSIIATVTWEPMVCFYTQTDAFGAIDIAACASLGIKLVTKHSRDVTHHLTTSLTAPLTPAVLYSLLSPARFVTPEWVVEFIRLGNDSDQGLEKTYNRPLESGFRPVIDSTLAELYPSMAKKAVWSPNDDRKALFDDMRFAFVVLGSGAGSMSKTMADVVSRGGATRQLINIEKEADEQANGASGTWGTVLKKRKVVLKEKMRSGLVLVGEEEAMIARGVPKEIRNAWEAMVENAKSVNMRIVHPSVIAEAIIKADVSVLDCVVEGNTSTLQGASASKPLPEHVPSTHPEEPSQLPPATRSRQPSVEASQTSGSGPSRRLTRRAASQTPAPEPAPPPVAMEVEEEPVTAPPKKLLKRRAKTVNAVGLVNELLGIDESTVLLDASQSLPQSQSNGQEHAQPVLIAPSQEIVPPTPARPSRLKRRAGTVAVTSQLFPDLPAVQEDGEEPPLKKFKTLFEESGLGVTHQRNEVSGSQMGAVREEEEESSQSQSQTQGRKRKADVMSDVADVEMQDVEGSTAPKRRAVEAVNSVEPSQPPKPPSSMKPVSRAGKATTGEKKPKSEKTKSGAAPGKPDTDPSFLRAIASTKRGKKTEDDFDREFNQLRIARPAVNNSKDAPNQSTVQWGKEWDGLDNFEKDVGVRGNFMQIVEMEVWRERQQPEQLGGHVRREEGLGARIDWDGREDFKKFKRKMNVQPRALVQLFVNEAQDTAGPSYWGGKGDKRPHGFDDMSQSQDDNFSPPTLTQTQLKGRTKSQPKSRPKPKPKSRIEMSEDQEDDEVEEAVGNFVSKGKGKASQKGKKVQALFNSESEDEDGGAGPGGSLHDDDEDVDLTLRSDKSQKERDKARGTKRKTVVREDSDSDDGITFGGFAKRAKRLKR